MALSGAGAVSATELDGSEGMLPPGTVIHFDREQLVMHLPSGSMQCGKSTISAKTANTGGSTETVKANVENLSFTECNSTFVVLKKGTFEIHTDPADSTGASSNGTLTWSGSELTTTYLGFHCIFSTNSTDLGTITGSEEPFLPRTLEIKATIPRTGGSSGAFCGSTAQWTGSYKITSPSTLNFT
jgi:hypothetical protein